MSQNIKIGSYLFSPETGVLTIGKTTKRLESRTSKLLAFFCKNAGDLITHEQIIDHIWDGRFISPNSVAVVISNIRKAFDDDAKNPRYIETLPKRGYRLIADIDISETPVSIQPASVAGNLKKSRPWKAALVILALLAIVIPGIALFNSHAGSNVTFVIIEPVSNATMASAYDPLSLSVTELIKIEINRQERLRMTSDEQAEYILSGRLILWDGHPSVSLHAMKPGIEEPIWSGMASGPETLLPRQVREEISKFAKSR